MTGMPHALVHPFPGFGSATLAEVGGKASPGSGTMDAVVRRRRAS